MKIVWLWYPVSDVLIWSWRQKGQREACKSEGMRSFRSMSGLLIQRSRETWLNISFHFNSKEQKRMRICCSHTLRVFHYWNKQKYSIIETSKTQCIYLSIAPMKTAVDKNSQMKFCIRTASERSLALLHHGTGKALLMALNFRDLPRTSQPCNAEEPIFQAENTWVSQLAKTVLLLHGKLCDARDGWESDPNQTPVNLVLRSNI